VTLSDLLISNTETDITIRNLVEQNKGVVLNPYMITPREFKLVAILGKAQWDETVCTQYDLPKPRK
jgi:hypothetical protein